MLKKIESWVGQQQKRDKAYRAELADLRKKHSKTYIRRFVLIATTLNVVGVVLMLALLPIKLVSLYHSEKGLAPYYDGTVSSIQSCVADNEVSPDVVIACLQELAPSLNTFAGFITALNASFDVWKDTEKGSDAYNKAAHSYVSLYETAALRMIIFDDIKSLDIHERAVRFLGKFFSAPENGALTDSYAFDWFIATQRHQQIVDDSLLCTLRHEDEQLLRS